MNYFRIMYTDEVAHYCSRFNAKVVQYTNQVSNKIKTPIFFRKNGSLNLSIVVIHNSKKCGKIENKGLFFLKKIS